METSHTQSNFIMLTTELQAFFKLTSVTNHKVKNIRPGTQPKIFKIVTLNEKSSSMYLLTIHCPTPAAAPLIQIQPHYVTDITLTARMPKVMALLLSAKAAFALRKGNIWAITGLIERGAGGARVAYISHPSLLRLFKFLNQ
ncbi:hypothetical protein MHYP_G00026210 [Metynnis hypsauchen]